MGSATMYLAYRSGITALSSCTWHGWMASNVLARCSLARTVFDEPQAAESGRILIDNGVTSVVASEISPSLTPVKASRE